MNWYWSHGHLVREIVGPSENCGTKPTYMSLWGSWARVDSTWIYTTTTIICVLTNSIFNDPCKILSATLLSWWNKDINFPLHLHLGILMLPHIYWVIINSLSLGSYQIHFCVNYHRCGKYRLPFPNPYQDRGYFPLSLCSFQLSDLSYWYNNMTQNLGRI